MTFFVAHATFNQDSTDNTMGLNDELSRKYPAKDHAHRVVEFLKAAGHDLNNAIIYLEGQKTRMIEDNDGEAPFR